MNRILDDVDQLETYAELGPPLSAIADVESDYRFLVTGGYLTFYRVQGSDVYVDRGSTAAGTTCACCSATCRTKPRRNERADPKMDGKIPGSRRGAGLRGFLLSGFQMRQQHAGDVLAGGLYGHGA